MLPVTLSCDVLAIQWIDDFIIVGVGNQLKIYQGTTNKLVSTVDTGHEDAIHNIVKSSNKLIVFGGRHLSIFNYKTKSDGINVFKKFQHVFTDWIISAEFFDEHSENIYILFAHNNLYLFHPLTKEFTNVLCEEKCILYGGYLSRESSEEIVIFSCTVFQEILLWKVNRQIATTNQDGKDQPVLHRLKGHKGVIFSVYYDPQLRLITSTSDDRTIRLWKVSQTDNNVTKSINWEKVDIELLTTMFGHTARVWKSVITPNNVISIGEDSHICIWSLHGKLHTKIIGHGGAPIWSIALSPDKSTIITGGGDGAVNSWHLDSFQTMELIPKHIYDDKTPKFVAYLNSGELIVFLDGGQLLLYNGVVDVKITNLPRFKSYCLMHTSPNRRKVALGSQDGFVVIFEEEEQHLEPKIKQKVISSKIFSLQWLNDEQILICGAQGQLKLLNLLENEIEEHLDFILPHSKERWTTSAILLETLLVCGDRAGSVFVFQTKNSTLKEPKQIFSKIHGRLGVQSFGLSGKKLMSTGRDGTLRFYQVLKNGADESLRCLHWKKMPMEWVSRTVRSENDIYVLGFKEIEFMIYSTRLDRLLLRIICGGGHRSWDCIFDNKTMNFTCIKDKQVHILDKISCESTKTVVSGLHTKEIHALSILPTSSDHKVIISGSEDCSIRISTLDSKNPSENGIKLLDTYDGHISNVKAIEILNLECSEKLSRNLVFSGGGRAQLKVWEIIVDTSGDSLTSDDVMGVELTSFMLRGTDKDRKKCSQTNKEVYFMDPETRFMDISAQFSPNNENTVILTVACSDGFIRVISYDVQLNKLCLKSEIPYFNRCILKLHSLLHQNQLILISMATDGFINLWSLDSLMKDVGSEEINDVKPFGRWRPHQSGINSYDVLKGISSNEYFIASGGDDNKVNFSVFMISRSSSGEHVFELKSSWESSSIHSAQVTGIKFMSKDRLMSVAIDQRIALYDFTYKDNHLHVTPIKILQTFVSDIQGLALYNCTKSSDESLAFVHGQGMEVLHQKGDLSKK